MSDPLATPTALQRLGFSQMLETVAERAVSSLGREEARNLRPLHDREEIDRRSARLTEVWSLAEGQSRLPLSGLADVGEILERARPADSALEPEELQAVCVQAHLIDRVAAFLEAHRAEAPHLAEDLAQLFPCPEVHREIDRCLTPAGEVADEASPEIARLRRERRRLDSTIRAEIDRLLRDPAVTSHLQEAYHTERRGRHVLPVIANHRGRVPGIVHDRSATGETLFVEPMALVELTNDLTEARLAEEAEVRRVLAALTDLVHRHLEALRASLATLGRLDCLAAVAEWGLAHQLHLTRRSSEESVQLAACHHPLLWIHQRGTSVPLDLALGVDDGAVVISGPNAGGKTTALKTVGLVQLMVQTGLPVPADPTSNIPVPRAVHADIGDDQDVVSGLSTFTAHMGHIAAICEHASAGDLVLLDELGTATDPQEGGALAVAILEALRARGCLTFATSHLVLLKQWAHETAGVQNASVGLDAATRRPTYRLTLGLPGPSEALVVAGQVGLRPEILARAREMVPEQEQRLSALIAELQEQQRALESLRTDAEKLRARLEEAERLHREAAREAERERRALRREAARERRRLLAEAKAEIERRIADLPTKRDLLGAKGDLESQIRAAEGEIAEMGLSPARGGGEFAVGDTVQILDANEQGQIISLDPGRGQARVETMHGMMLNIPLNRLAPLPPARGKGTGDGGEETRGGVTFARKPDVSSELNLIGMRVEPALQALDKFLDEAASHGLTSVRVVHGFGTGALRAAVREFVARHPLAKSWRPAEFSAGGQAVTVVEIR
jgi:DNA mismatch repair protein MutS2